MRNSKGLPKKEKLRGWEGESSFTYICYKLGNLYIRRRSEELLGTLMTWLFGTSRVWSVSPYGYNKRLNAFGIFK